LLDFHDQPLFTVMDITFNNAWVESYLDALVRELVGR
jgi:hypothetical protein